SSDVAATVSFSGSLATLQPTAALVGNTTYQVTVSGTVANTSGSTLGTDATWTFTTQPYSLTDTTAASFALGITGGTYIAQAGNGEVTLAPATGSEFSGSSLPIGWSSWTAGGGTAIVANGVLTVDGAWAGADALVGPGHSLQFRATFGGGAFQHGGFALDLMQPAWAIFSTN